jgi:parvulin-like peptidyl-prolyl isomerase
VVKPASAGGAKPPAAAAPAPSVASVFSKLVNELSEDQASKRFGGSLGSKTRAELEKVHPEIAAVLFSLPQNAVSEVIETPQGFYIARVNVVREALTLDQVRPQIQMRLARKQDEKARTDFVEKLEADAKVVIDEKAVEAVDLSELLPPGPGTAPASGKPAENK